MQNIESQMFSTLIKSFLSSKSSSSNDFWRSMWHWRLE